MEEIRATERILKMKVSITKVKDEWQNNPPKGFNLVWKKRPTATADSFLYKWDFEIHCPKLLKEAGFNEMYYGGYSKDGTDLYIFSSDDELANKLVISTPDMVKKTLTILDWGKVDSMKRAESDYLDDNDAVKDPQWFNKQNNFGKNLAKKPDYDKIGKLSYDWYILKNNRKDLENQLTFHTFDDIKDPRPFMDFHPSNMKNLQPRDKVSYQDLLNSIRFMIDKAIIDGTDITERAKPPVVFKDRTWDGEFYDEILACGKHTTTGYTGHKHGKFADTSWIEVGPEILDQFTDVELYKAANEDNRNRNSDRPIVKEDIIKELKYQVKKGGEWNTPEEKDRAERMLRTDSWLSICKSMETWEENEKRLDNGLTSRINWRDKDRLEEVKEMAREGMKENPDTWYNPTPYSSDSLKYGINIIKPYKMWIKDNNIKNPPRKIMNYIYHSFTGADVKFEKDGGNEQVVYEWCSEESNLEIDYIPLPEFEEEILIGKNGKEKETEEV